MSRGEWGERWPEGHPLPLPTWEATSRREGVRARSVEEYEDLAAQVELANQQLLRAHPYNTVGNFVRFYDACAARPQSSVERVFREYRPPITPAHHTCVGLGLTLLGTLAARRPDLHGALHLVSCEEAVDNAVSYTAGEPGRESSEKEHVLVAARIDIAGRRGVLLLDPGYHVARVVTVMEDGLYPHTGWFTQSDEPQVRREYQYSLSSDGKYVVWTVRETRRDRQTIATNLVYIDKAFLSAVDVTERRNIVYNFRSLLARNNKGQLIAGVYFPLAVVQEDSGPDCTIFHTEVGGNRKIRVKVPFHLLLDPEAELSVEQEMALVLCSRQLGFPDDHLEELLTKVSAIMADKTFMTHVLAINQAVSDLSEDN